MPAAKCGTFPDGVANSGVCKSKSQRTLPDYDGRTAYSIKYSEAIERQYVEEGLSDNPYLSNK